MDFVDSPNCKSRVHCVSCRTSAQWRAGFNAPEVCPVDMRGMGEVIARIAQPIARAIDTVVGTDVAGCKSCKEVRQPFLNRLLPFG